LKGKISLALFKHKHLEVKIFTTKRIICSYEKRNNAPLEMHNPFHHLCHTLDMPQTDYRFIARQ